MSFFFPFLVDPCNRICLVVSFFFLLLNLSVSSEHGSIIMPVLLSLIEFIMTLYVIRLASYLVKETVLYVCNDGRCAVLFSF